MNTLKFKTNMKCSGCVAAITPGLDGIIEIDKWEVDLSSADKVLTVNAHSPLSASLIVQILKDKGFHANALT